MALFGVKEGIKIHSGIKVDILTGDFDPASTGLAAPEGSIFLKKDGLTFKKTGPNDTDWVSYGEIEAAGLIWKTRSSNFTATDGEGYVLDLSGGSLTSTLPSSPAIGHKVGYVSDGNAESNPATIDPGSENINSASDTLEINLNYAFFEMLYAGSSLGWVISNTDESGNVNNIREFIGNTDNADAGLTEYTEENYIVSGDPLEDAVDKLDQSLQDVSDMATQGVKRRAMIQGITNDDPSTVTSGNFSDDEEPYWSDSDWQTGDQVLSTDSTQFGKVFEWDGSAWWIPSVVVGRATDVVVGLG